MNSKVLWGIIAVVVILGGIWWLAASDTTPNGATGNALDSVNGNGDNNNSGNSGDQTTGVQGRVVFSVTDAAANLSNLSEVNAVISRVEVFSQARGWVTLSSTPRAYNLLQLKADNQSKILADLNTTVGDYSQVRVTLDSVAVKPKTGAAVDARLPGKSLTIPLTTKVRAEGTASVNLDFLVDKSLHTTIDGDYIFAPVVKAESKSNATVNVTTGTGIVTISGGNTDSTQTVGMDIDGSVKVNFQLNSGTKLDIDASGVIKVQ